MAGIPDYEVQPDPKEPPSPAGGWSEQLLNVPNALIVPGDGRGMRQKCGVFDAEGHFVPSAVLYRGHGPLMLPPKLRSEREEETLPGIWMWGGVLLNHFGHFLTETLARIWAYPDVADQISGIVFLHKRNGQVNSFHQQFYRLCQVDTELRTVKTPTRVQQLLVPGQGTGLGAISYGTAKHHAFFRSRFAKDVEPEGPKRLYVSRSSLKLGKGGAIGETQLETYLEQQGYEIFHPQQHPLEVQIARYMAAEKIIGLDGSALHLAGFCVRPEQDVAIIWRRSSGAAENIVKQLHGATGKKPLKIKEIEIDWVVASRNRADRFSIGQIDVPTIGQTLAAQGFLDTNPNWAPIDKALVEKEIAALSAQTGVEYIPMLGNTRHKARLAELSTPDKLNAQFIRSEFADMPSEELTAVVKRPALTTRRQKLTRIFQIGFNKCGTRSLYRFLQRSGIYSCHFNRGLLALKMQENLAAGYKPLAGRLDQYVAFTDVQRVAAEGVIEGAAFFRQLHAYYPDSYFILNIRDKEGWLRSRARHGAGNYMKRYGKALGLSSDEETLDYWSTQWDQHLEAVQSFFADKPGRMLIYDIKQDDPESICDFLAPDFITDPSHFRHEGETEKVERSSYLSNRPVVSNSSAK
ncbi:MAG: glycosyltransferase 61 family protein [Tateyamaria sp.]|uniref:glycosyltransferase 61 family protein n=1 Tax=Tateyamaria sp. TaxID=1929288 RepID=UPI00329CBC7C